MIIAADTSTIVAYLQGENGEDVTKLDHSLEQGTIVLPPVVLTELLSDPKLPLTISKFLKSLPLLKISNGFWERAGTLRASVLAKGHKARLGDAFIAQSCIDHSAALLTRDKDFRHYARKGKLKLI